MRKFLSTRFSLRALLGVMAIGAIALAWYRNSVIVFRQQLDQMEATVNREFDSVERDDFVFGMWRYDYEILKYAPHWLYHEDILRVSISHLSFDHSGSEAVAKRARLLKIHTYEEVSLNDLRPLVGPQLRRLELYCPELKEDAFHDLHQWRRLEEMDVRGGCELSAALLRDLMSHRPLTDINVRARSSDVLGMPEFAGDGLRWMDIEVLPDDREFDYTAGLVLSDRHLQFLKGSKQLWSLDIENGVDASAIAWIANNFPELGYLQIRGKFTLSDESARQLRSMKSLKSLSIDRVSLSEASAQLLRPLTHPSAKSASNTGVLPAAN